MPEAFSELPQPQRPKRQRKGSSHQRGYGQLHRTLRAARLALHPVCEACGKAFAVEAHHVKWPAVTIEDYRCLCVECHRQEHQH